MRQLDVAKSLGEVIDPELGIDVVSLGLVYGIECDGDRLGLQITLTSPDCPMAEVLAGMIASNLRRLAGARQVEIQVVEDPPWDVGMLDASARRLLGLPL